jgi:hypothetical protein
MNKHIQRFDIACTLNELFEELITSGGRSREEAMSLMMQAIGDWRASMRDEQPHGTKMKAYVDLRTHKISREPEREPGVDECQFDDVTAAAIYVAELERPMLERMRAGGLGDK